jgi:hypothetical protein
MLCHIITRERLIGFSWNFVWRWCRQRLVQSRTSKNRTIGNTNATDAQSRHEGGRSSAITYDCLRELVTSSTRTAYVTCENWRYQCWRHRSCWRHLPYAKYNSRMADRIFMKFYIDVMPLETAPNWHFLATVGNTNVTDARCCEVGRWSSAIMPLSMILYCNWLRRLWWRHRSW